ncbi:hypothetical protein TNCV_1512391 [Trichonephila clavipes]|nr:hypothetical protein TNCV_1512391 [Trichonephila clavipes]
MAFISSAILGMFLNSETELEILSHGQVTRTIPEQATHSSNFCSTPTGELKSLDRFNAYQTHSNADLQCSRTPDYPNMNL